MTFFNNAGAMFTIFTNIGILYGKQNFCPVDKSYPNSVFPIPH